MKWLKEKWSKFYRQFISLKGTPEAIGRAFGVGFWIAWFPLIGTHSVLSFLLGAAFRVNLPAVYLASWLCNPLTIPVMLTLDYELGAALVGHANVANVDFSSITFKELLNLGWDVVFPMIIGGALLGTVNAFIGYFLVKRAVRRLRTRGLERDLPEPLD